MAHRSLTVIGLAFASSLFLAACASSVAPGPTATVTPTLLATEVVSSPSATAVPTVTATPESTATPEPAPEAAFAPTVDLTVLERMLNDLADAYASPGEFAFAVTDLQTGETVGVNINRPHLTGCTVNYFVLLQSVLDVQSGRVDESTVGDLISATIRTSNPVTARDLYRIAGNGDVVSGVERVARLIDRLSGSDAVFDHPPLFAGDSLGVNRNNWITAAAMNEALRATYADGLLEERWLDYLLEKMTGVKDGLNYLLAVGPDVPVSHKNGFFPTDSGKWVDNDIGIVRFEQDGQERAYAVSFFSQFVPEKYGDVRLGQQLSTATWDFFQQRYPPEDSVSATADGTRD